MPDLSKIALILFLILGILFLLYLSIVKRNQTQDNIVFYTFEVVNKYPHDTNAFTQGLVYHNGYIYEGTGRYGHSTLRQVELKTAKVIQLAKLPDKHFGEGITVYDDKIIQLTYRSGTGFIYDKTTFTLLKTFRYPREGWGITHNEKHLIVSDGTANLYFLDPKTFKELFKIVVRAGRKPVKNLNELEYIKGEVYANVWKSNRIARIEPKSGNVVGWIDLTGIISPEDYKGKLDVLNGIAYDAYNERLFVTGKLWPVIFEIKLIINNN